MAAYSPQIPFPSAANPTCVPSKAVSLNERLIVWRGGAPMRAVSARWIASRCDGFVGWTAPPTDGSTDRQHLRHTFVSSVLTRCCSWARAGKHSCANLAVPGEIVGPFENICRHLRANRLSNQPSETCDACHRWRTPSLKQRSLRFEASGRGAFRRSFISPSST
jgi:hypothetical protein